MFPVLKVHVWFLQTSAGGLGLVPLGVVGVHALHADGALLQGVAGVAGELHHGAQRPRGVAAGQVAVLDEGLVAVTGSKGCGAKGGGRSSGPLAWTENKAEPPRPFESRAGSVSQLG